MQDLDELQRRLTGALDRIGSGLDRLGPAPDETSAPSVDVAGLLAELEAERARSAQLEDRLHAAAATGDGRAAGIDAALAAIEEDRSRLKAANEALSRSNEMLQKAALEGVPDPGLLDAAMRQELDALKAVHASDRAELNAIVAMLEPMARKQEEADEDA